MVATTVLHAGDIEIVAYDCAPGPAVRPYIECHDRHSISYVRAGSFGYRARGRYYEMVPGAIVAGRADDEYMCTHDHHLGGDRCLSIQFSSAFLEATFTPAGKLASRGLPPLPVLVVAGELLGGCVDGSSDVALDEAALLVIHRYLHLVDATTANHVRPTSRETHLAVEAALWIDGHAASEVTLNVIAAQVALSPYHFLRIFSRVLGVTPHQYLLRARLRHAARLLTERDFSVTDIAYAVGFADLSNFIRTFRRAAGVSPRGFRLATRGQREHYQALLAVDAA